MSVSTSGVCVIIPRTVIDSCIESGGFADSFYGRYKSIDDCPTIEYDDFILRVQYDNLGCIDLSFFEDNGIELSKEVDGTMFWNELCVIYKGSLLDYPCSWISVNPKERKAWLSSMEWVEPSRENTIKLSGKSLSFDGKYKHVRFLGEGGFGNVYLAQELYSNRYVAIKSLKEKKASRQNDIIHEMSIVSKFNHPNIVTLKHHYKNQGCLYLVMEYCAGSSLRKKILQNKKIDIPVAIPWFVTLAETLQKVHDEGIVHHDIKPDNILFTKDGVVKISDFGVANKNIGTLAYIAPEQRGNQNFNPLDTRIDIFALGITLLETVTGENPLMGKSVEQAKEILDKNTLIKHELPIWLQGIIQKATHPKPEFRFQKMSDFANALRSNFTPVLLDSKLIKAGDLAGEAEKYLHRKKWEQALKCLNTALHVQPDNLMVLKSKGRYHLYRNEISKASECFEKVLHLNAKSEVYKELGWIQLELGKYPEAISLLNDFVSRNPNDPEAHNLLARCFFEVGHYEQTAKYFEILIDRFPNVTCFKNNLFISLILLGVKPTDIDPKIAMCDNPFRSYNYWVLNEESKSWSYDSRPFLKYILLFQDYRFEKILKNENRVIFDFGDSDAMEYSNNIITFGRKGYIENLINRYDGTTISRRHFLIVNSKDDVWLYDLASTGTFVDGKLVAKKKFLHGLHEIRVGNNSFTVKSDAGMLL